MSAPIFSDQFSGNVTNHTSNSFVPFNLAHWERIFVAILVGLIAVMGIVGNSMIIMAVAFSRKLQTSTNAFVVSLSVADLLTSFFLIWYMVGLLGQNDWPLPKVEWLCGVTAFVIFACTGTSIYTLAVIGMNRLILITKPNVYRRIFTSWKLGLLVALPWFIPFSFGTISISNGLGAVGYDKSDLSCSDLDLHENGDLFNTLTTIVALPIPLLTIVVSYTWIYVFLKKHFRKQKVNLTVLMIKRKEAIQISEENTETCTEQIMTSEEGIINKSYCDTEESFPASETPIKPGKKGSTKPRSNMTRSVASSVRKTISHRQVEITKNLFIVVCAFFACFVPYFVLNPILGTSHAIYYIRILPLANSAINFVIYVRKHPEFKVVLGCMMRCSYSNIPKPSRILKFFISKKT